LWIDEGQARQKRNQMLCHADRADPGTASTMRDTKSLVQIEVANVRPVIAGAAKTDLGVHVGAIQINLPAMRMHDLANLPDGRLKDSVRARIRHHERSQIGRMLIRLRAEVSQINV